jgi:hypothetical protein
MSFSLGKLIEARQADQYDLHMKYIFACSYHVYNKKEYFSSTKGMRN